ncbi:unnamed protein product [Moneuplotes crassus]|uniref:Uncharacterized protein n=1 Tax=Euplotes crassus TaxID=5936 RepID=A0AAD1Y2S2_EUPCR|nr:unnamed protein product [Moneuplotes crassus]
MPPKGAESLSSLNQSSKFQSPPKHKKDFYLDTGTFLTEGEKHEETGNIKLLSGFPNANYINETYSEITGCLDTLNQRIKTVVDSNQDVFISAYKDSMNKMNSELKDIKYRMSSDKMKEKQEQKLKLVEKERDWFRDEALRLNRKCKKLEEEIKRVKSYYNSKK